MKKLLSLPPNLVGSFHEIANADPADWFCTSDPVGARLGSGGGTTWLLELAAGMTILLERCRLENGWRVKSGFYCMPEAEPAFTGICTVGQDIDTDSGVPVGEGTEIISEPPFASTSVV